MKRVHFFLSLYKWAGGKDGVSHGGQLHMNCLREEGVNSHASQVGDKPATFKLGVLSLAQTVYDQESALEVCHGLQS